jgi:NAD+ synthase (glutamine-hydrolysing)
MTKLRVAGAALNQIPIDWKNNLKNIEDAIHKARQQQVDILCLPELTLCGYGCEDMFLSAWLYERALEKLEEVRQFTTGITVAVGLPMKFEGHNYDVSCIIHNQKILGFTAKQFLAEDGVHYEPRWFSPWPANKKVEIEINGLTYPFGDVTYSVHGIKIGFEICEDAWRNEQRPGYRLAERGVQLILNTSASHFSFGKSAFREQLIIPASKTFGCAYVFANMLGNEAGRMIYDGEIMIAQEGRLLQKNKRFSYQNVDMVSALINFDDPDASEHTPSQDSTQKEIEFVRAETLALFDYLRKSRAKGFVVSLSGGADSSSCCVLIAEMIRRGVRELGAEYFLQKLGLPHLLDELQLSGQQDEEKVYKRITGKLLTTAYQATENSSHDTYQAAKELADSVGATFFHWNIDQDVASYTQTVASCLGRSLNWEEDDIALQNIQARSRIPGIWMLTNVLGALLISTNNRSEADVGYATMDGCTSGSIAPIAAVDKYFVLHWLKWAEKELNYPGLSYVNQLNPTAELRPQEQSQTDEGDLMPYAILQAIERLAIRDWKPPVEIFKILKEQQLEEDELLKEHIRKFFKLWSRNQWKRERVAPAFHIDDFNVDPRTWCRFPILSGGYEEEINAMDEL